MLAADDFHAFGGYSIRSVESVHGIEIISPKTDVLCHREFPKRTHVQFEQHIVALVYVQAEDRNVSVFFIINNTHMQQRRIAMARLNRRRYYDRLECSASSIFRNVPERIINALSYDTSIFFSDNRRNDIHQLRKTCYFYPVRIVQQRHSEPADNKGVQQRIPVVEYVGSDFPVMLLLALLIPHMIGRYRKNDVAGLYKLVCHGDDITKEIKTSVPVELGKDGSVSGSYSGKWRLSSGNKIEIELDGTVYKGVVLKQRDTDNMKMVFTFTALSDSGTAIWGSKAIIQDRTLN